MTLPLSIVYEDAHLLFVNKVAGVVVQQSRDPDEPHLFQAAAHYLRPSGQEPFLLQRLDRDTTGVMFFSKSRTANPHLSRQFETRQLKKTYAAIVTGRIDSERLIDGPIGRIGPISFGVIESGRRALTRIEPLGWSGDTTLLRVHLLTGRTHQIRVHLAWIGHPLLGDFLYGVRDEQRTRLHSSSIQMVHPATEEPLDVSVSLPADFVTLYPDGDRLLSRPHSTSA